MTVNSENLIRAETTVRQQPWAKISVIHINYNLIQYFTKSKSTQKKNIYIPDEQNTKNLNKGRIRGRAGPSQSLRSKEN